MVQFNELGISSDGNQIVIDVQVKDLNYYTDVFLDTIKIDTQDTYVSTGVSSTPVYTSTISGSEKRVQLTLSGIDLNNININDSLLFIYVGVKGTPSPDTPCGMDEIVTIGVLVNTYKIYELGMKYLRQVESECVIPKEFIDLVLKQKAFELALYTKNYIQAIKYWNKFFKNQSIINTYDCGCR